MTHPGGLSDDRAQSPDSADRTRGSDTANMLFQVVNGRRRRRRAMVLTTSKALSGSTTHPLQTNVGRGGQSLRNPSVGISGTDEEKGASSRL